MSRLLNTSLSVLGCALLVSATNAQVKRNSVDAGTASANAEKLVKDITWIESQPKLTKDAEASGKLIFYMHMLGNLAGNT